MMEVVTKRKPLISVVIDTYNYARFIEEAIDSVVQQDFPEEQVEVIVVDDGSTDDTAERVKKFRDRVRYIQKENGGQGSAYNAGFESSSGEIICLLDADDYWFPTKLRQVAEQFSQSEEVNVVYHLLEIVESGGKSIGVVPHCPRRETVVVIPSEEYFQRLSHFAPPSSGISVRATCLRRIMPVPVELRINADSYLHLFLPLHANSVTLINLPLGCFRVHGENYGSWGAAAFEANKLRWMVNARRILAEHSRARGVSSSSIVTLQQALIDSEIAKLEILLHNVSGEKRIAVPKAWSYNHFPPKRTMMGKLIGRFAIILYALLPPTLFERLKGFYRSLVPFH